MAIVCAADLCACASDSMTEIETLDRVFKGVILRKPDFLDSIESNIRVQYSCVSQRCSVMEEEMIFHLSCLSEFAV